VLIVPDGEEGGANVLRVNDTLLAGSDFPRTMEMLATHGVEPVPLARREIGKIDAGLTCMSLRWHA
jgi:dimethylargininase